MQGNECNLFKHNFFRKFGNVKEIDNRFFISREKKFIYCEVPKVAITTVKKTFAESLSNQKVDYNVHDREKFILKSPYQNSLSKKEFDDYFKFAFVRNPYTRILSGYLDKIKNNTIEKQQLCKIANVPEDYEMSFIEFLKILEKIPPVNINVHFRPQYLTLCYPLIQYDFIGKFETLEHDFQVILNRFFSSKEEIMTIDHHKTDANKKLEEYYTLQTMQLVQKIYAQDFLYFNYSMLF